MNLLYKGYSRLTEPQQVAVKYAMIVIFFLAGSFLNSCESMLY